MIRAVKCLNVAQRAVNDSYAYIYNDYLYVPQ